jgi:Zn-dependent protease
MDIQSKLAQAFAFLPIFLFSICFHEFAHGLMAKWKGDRTAEFAGRLTMNPFAHADLLGTVIFPILGFFTGFFFGWAKPVPVNERNLRNPRKDLFWVALAGPMANVFLALVMALILGFVFKYLSGSPMLKTIGGFGTMFMYTNLGLAVFNALPIHPLDGGKIIARFIPHHVDRWLEENQFMLFIALMFILQTPFAGYLRLPIDFLFNFLISASEALWNL